MKKRVVGSSILVVIVMFVLLVPQKVFGQSFVKDNAGVLSAETIAKINQSKRCQEVQNTLLSRLKT